MGQLHVGILLPDACHHLAPQLRHLQHIGLLHRSEPPLPLLRRLEGHVRNALDLRSIVGPCQTRPHTLLVSFSCCVDAERIAALPSGVLPTALAIIGSALHDRALQRGRSSLGTAAPHLRLRVNHGVEACLVALVVLAKAL